MKEVLKRAIIPMLSVLITGCSTGGDGAKAAESTDDNSTSYEKPVKIGAMIWGDYTQEEIQFIANAPRIKLVSCLGNVDASDAILMKQLNQSRPSLWFRTSLNIGESVEGKPDFFGFWTQELYGAPEHLFLHYNPSTIDLVTSTANALGIDPQSVLPYNSRVTDNLWSTYIADPGEADWQSFWRDQVKKQVLQEGTFDGVRMDVFYETLDGWTKPAVNVTKEQLDQLQEKIATLQTQNDFEDAVETIYKDRLPKSYDANQFRVDMLALMRGVKEELKERPLAVNPMWPSYDGTFAFYREYAAIADILEIEMFVTKAGSNTQSYQPLEVWSKQVGTMIWNTLNGKTTLAFARGFSFDTERRMYALASYLLGQGPESLFYYEAMDFELSGERLGYWAQLSYLPEWEIAIGAALDHPQSHLQQDHDPKLLLDQYYDDDLGIYVRQFQNGVVLINPTNQGQKRAYTFEKSAYLVQPVGGNVSPIHRMEDAAVLEDARAEEIIGKNPKLKEDFNRVGTLEYTPVSTIELNPLEAAIVLYAPDKN